LVVPAEEGILYITALLAIKRLILDLFLLSFFICKIENTDIGGKSHQASKSVLTKEESSSENWT
jgi:hypothetical protein